MISETKGRIDQTLKVTQESVISADAIGCLIFLFKARKGQVVEGRDIVTDAQLSSSIAEYIKECMEEKGLEKLYPGAFHPGATQYILRKPFADQERTIEDVREIMPFLLLELPEGRLVMKEKDTDGLSEMVDTAMMLIKNSVNADRRYPYDLDAVLDDIEEVWN